MSEPTTPDTPGADPGNSEPDSWSAPLTDDEYGEAVEMVNAVAVELPDLPSDEGGE